jgi:putative lipoprotein
MLVRSRKTLLAGLILVQSACGGMDITVNPVVPLVVRFEGTAVYSEPVELPGGAVLRVLIEDVSRADAAADVVAETRVDDPGRLPAGFAIEYAADRILPGHRYNVRGRVEQQGRLLFISDSRHALPSPGGAAPFELHLVRTGVSPASTAQLENTYWRLVMLGEVPFTSVPGQRETHLVLQATREGERRVAGFGGCSRLTGGYSLDGQRIAFTDVTGSDAAGTTEACSEGMDAEKAFQAMLGKVDRWAIRGEQLDLFDASGTRIALLESVYLR